MITIPKAKFPLGQVVITANAAQHLDTIAVREALRRHAAGDWGDIPPDDACENELSLKEGFRLLSACGPCGPSAIGERTTWSGSVPWRRSPNAPPPVRTGNRTRERQDPGGEVPAELIILRHQI